MINEEKCIFRPLLFWSDNCTNDDLNFAFAIIFSFADVISEHWKNNTSPDTSTPLSNNVIKIKDIIYKYYLFSSARRFEYQIKFLKAQIDISTPSFTVIKYRFINGKHEPSHIRHFLALIYFLRQIHDQDLAHGDIRLSNCLFLDESQSAIFIDFDFCGKENISTYPDGFNLEISDGKRHINAKAGNHLEKIHDCFSLGL
jgi:hypothetical protein